MSTKKSSPNPRKVRRNFLNPEEKEEIERLMKNGFDAIYIASKVHHSERQIKNYIRERQKNAENRFTREQDRLIIQQIQQGNNSPTKIANLLDNKADWMVRNRIKLFKRKSHGFENLLDIDLFLDQFHDKMEEKKCIDIYQSIDIVMEIFKFGEKMQLIE